MILDPSDCVMEEIKTNMCSTGFYLDSIYNEKITKVGFNKSKFLEHVHTFFT